MSFGGRYVDRFERRDGTWKIAHRAVVHEWDKLEHIEPAYSPGHFRDGVRSPATSRTAPDIPRSRPGGREDRPHGIGGLRGRFGSGSRPELRRAHLSEIGARTPISCEESNELHAVELALARRDAVGETVLLVVGQLGLSRAVVHLHRAGRSPGSARSIESSFAPRRWCQMSAQYPPLGRPAASTIACAVRRRRDVRVRQPLHADEEAVRAGPVAQRSEGLAGLGDRALVRADRLEVPAAAPSASS